MRILCIDFDDVIFNTKPYVEKIIKSIKEEASEEYLVEKANLLRMGIISHEEYQLYHTMHFDYKNRILEEVDEEYKNRIDYESIFENEDIFPGNKGYIDYLMNSPYFDKIYVLSHCNCEREINAKRKFLNKFFPGLELISVPFHKDKYGTKPVRLPTSKAEFFMDYMGITSLENCMLVDDSSTNYNDWKKHGGIAVKYKYDQGGHMDFENNAVNSLNPFALEIIGAEHEYITKTRK